MAIHELLTGGDVDGLPSSFWPLRTRYSLSNKT